MSKIYSPELKDYDPAAALIVTVQTATDFCVGDDADVLSKAEGGAPAVSVSIDDLVEDAKNYGKSAVQSIVDGVVHVNFGRRSTDQSTDL